MKLFEPIQIRGMAMPNRIIYPAIQFNQGLRSARAKAYYAERGRGGAGTIIAGATSIDALGSEEPWKGAGGLEGFLQSLRPGVQEVKATGARFGIQLWQGNLYPAGAGGKRAGVEINTGGERVAPSPGENGRALTITEIQDIIHKFGAAAAGAKKAGFDFVEVHGAHGYLPCRFFSPLANQRTDRYGGDLARRMRFGLECVAAIRAAVGPDYPIFFRLGAEENEPGGVTLKDSIPFARELEKAGVDCLNVSVGIPYPHLQASPSQRYAMGTFAHLAAAVKDQVKVPVVAVGRIQTGEVAEDILAQGKADLVAIARPLMCDAFWPRKVREGREDQIVVCDCCNVNCFSPIEKRRLPPDAPLCHFNPRLGREWEMPAPE